MALRGFSESLAARGVQTDLKIVGAADAGTFYMLGSQANYLQLASQAVTHVSEWDVTTTGITASDIVLGVEVKETQVNDFARVRPLAPGDTIRTSMLASGSDVGAIDGSLAPNTKLSIDPATGKLRQKQAVDVELLRIASDGGNLFDTDGTIWAEVVDLK